MSVFALMHKSVPSLCYPFGLTGKKTSEQTVSVCVHSYVYSRFLPSAVHLLVLFQTRPANTLCQCVDTLMHKAVSFHLPVPLRTYPREDYRAHCVSAWTLTHTPVPSLLLFPFTFCSNPERALSVCHTQDSVFLTFLVQHPSIASSDWVLSPVSCGQHCC